MGACGSSGRKSADGKYTSNPAAYADGAGAGAAGSGSPAPPPQKGLPAMHEGAIFDMAVAGTSHIVTAGEDHRLVMTNWQTREVCDTWVGHTKVVNRVVCGRQENDDGSFGRFVYSASRDATVCQWARGQASPVARFEGHDMTVNAVDTNDQETVLCSGSRDNTVRAWDINTSQEVAKNLTPRNLVTCLKFVHGEPNCVAQGSEDLTLRVWDLRIEDGAGSTITPNVVAGRNAYQYFPLCLDVSVSWW